MLISYSRFRANNANRSDEGLTLETPALKLFSVANLVDKTKIILL